MKKVAYTMAFFCFTSLKLMGQLELKTQPFVTFLPFRSPNISVEYGFQSRLGVELAYQRLGGKSVFNTSFQARASAYYVSVKRYLDKDASLDGFYVGGYVSHIKGIVSTTNYSMFSLGVASGYKKLFLNDHLVLEPNINVGKRYSFKNSKAVNDTDLGNNQIKFFYYWDINLRLQVGYRF
jgi:hypothetical protein